MDATRVTVQQRPARAEIKPILVATDLHKVYRATIALSGVSITVEPGVIHAIVGPNGAGKSTLVKVLAGAVRPDLGTLTVAGRSAPGFQSPAEALAAGIHVVHQDPQGFPELSVADNVLISTPPSRRWGPIQLRSRGTARERAHVLLEQMGLSLPPATKLGALSLADRTLVQICRAVAEDLKVLILDEPTATLGQDDAERVYDVCQNLCDRGVAVIVVTHRLHEVVTYASHVTALRDGKVVADIRESDLGSDELIELVAGRSLPAVSETHASENSEPLLEVHRLEGRGFVGPVDLAVPAGEAIALTGLPGSGAQDCLRVIAGVAPATAGKVRLGNGQPPTEAIGFVPADRKNEGIFPDLSIRDNIVISSMHTRSLRPLRRRALRQEAVRLIKLLGITPSSPDLPASRLSGGNQQKVLLARWILAGRAVLIVEEPTNGLDVGAKRDVHELLKQYLQGGRAIVALSSEEQEAVTLGSKVAVFRDRSLAAVLPAAAGPAEVLRAAMPTSRRQPAPDRLQTREAEA